MSAMTKKEFTVVEAIDAAEAAMRRVTDSPPEMSDIEPVSRFAAKFVVLAFLRRLGMDGLADCVEIADHGPC